MCTRAWCLEEALENTEKSIRMARSGLPAMQLYSAYLGTEREAIVQASGIDPEVARQMEALALQNCIWKDGEVHCDWFNSDKDVAAMSLRLDALSLMGLVERA